MTKYAAFLRGVTPSNLAMTSLKAALERAGFTEVRTLLSSGNVVFSAKTRKPEGLEATIEAALAEELGKNFMTFVRPIATLEAMLEANPYSAFRPLPDAKRVVTFLRRRLSTAEQANIKLPIEKDGVRILTVRDREVFTDYVRSPRGPVFMTLIEKTFGKETTTRTWDTVKKAIR